MCGYSPIINHKCYINEHSTLITNNNMCSENVIYLDCYYILIMPSSLYGRQFPLISSTLNNISSFPLRYATSTTFIDICTVLLLANMYINLHFHTVSQWPIILCDFIIPIYLVAPYGNVISVYIIRNSKLQIN